MIHRAGVETISFDTETEKISKQLDAINHFQSDMLQKIILKKLSNPFRDHRIRVDGVRFRPGRSEQKRE